MATEQDDRRSGGLLSIRGLKIGFGKGPPIVADVDLDLRAGRIVALVGETGAGKSLAAMALAGLLPAGSISSASSFRLGTQDLSRLDEDAWCSIRGRQIGVVFQDPFTALDPLMRIGHHLDEAIRAHEGIGRAERQQRATAALLRVGLLDTDRILRAYPEELSGGMRQRVQIALALLLDPAIVIADEPTASLDADASDGILDLIVGLCRERGTAALLVSHDLRSIRSRADDALVMVGGRVVEAGPVEDVFAQPRHPFTQALLAASDLAGPPSSPALVLRPSTGRGCRYGERCPVAVPICHREDPALTFWRPGHSVACHVMGAPE